MQENPKRDEIFFILPLPLWSIKSVSHWCCEIPGTQILSLDRRTEKGFRVNAKWFKTSQLSRRSQLEGGFFGLYVNFMNDNPNSRRRMSKRGAKIVDKWNYLYIKTQWFTNYFRHPQKTYRIMNHNLLIGSVSDGEPTGKSSTELVLTKQIWRLPKC